MALGEAWASLAALLHIQYEVRGPIVPCETPLRSIIVAGTPSTEYAELKVIAAVPSAHRLILADEKGLKDVTTFVDVVLGRHTSILLRIIRQEDIHMRIKPFVVEDSRAEWSVSGPPSIDWPSDPVGAQVAAARDVLEPLRLLARITRKAATNRRAGAYISVDLLDKILLWFGYEPRVYLPDLGLFVPIERSLRLEPVRDLSNSIDATVLVSPALAASRPDVMRLGLISELDGAPVDPRQSRWHMPFGSTLALDAVATISSTRGLLSRDAVDPQNLRGFFWSILRVESIPFIGTAKSYEIRQQLDAWRQRSELDGQPTGIHSIGYMRPRITFHMSGEPYCVVVASGPWLIRGAYLTRPQMVEAVERLRSFLQDAFGGQVEIVPTKDGIVSSTEIELHEAIGYVFPDAPSMPTTSEEDLSADWVRRTRARVRELDKQFHQLQPGDPPPATQVGAGSGGLGARVKARLKKARHELGLLEGMIRPAPCRILPDSRAKVTAIRLWRQRVSELERAASLRMANEGWERDVQAASVLCLSELHDLCEDVLRFDYALMVKQWPIQVKERGLQKLVRVDGEPHALFHEFLRRYESRLETLRARGDLMADLEEYFWTVFSSEYSELVSSQLPELYDLPLDEDELPVYAYDLLLVTAVRALTVATRNRFRHSSQPSIDVPLDRKSDENPRNLLKDVEERCRPIDACLTHVERIIQMQRTLLGRQHRGKILTLLDEVEEQLKTVSSGTSQSP